MIFTVFDCVFMLCVVNSYPNGNTDTLVSVSSQLITLFDLFPRGFSFTFNFSFRPIKMRLWESLSNALNTELSSQYFHLLFFFHSIFKYTNLNGMEPLFHQLFAMRCMIFHGTKFIISFLHSHFYDLVLFQWADLCFFFFFVKLDIFHTLN